MCIKHAFNWTTIVTLILFVAQASAQTLDLSFVKREVMGETPFWAIRNHASLVANHHNFTPEYASTYLEQTVFQGTYTPSDSDKHLAIFSDDGCMVMVNGRVIHNRYEERQHLPNLPQSLHLLPIVLRKNQSYDIVVFYQNKIFIPPNVSGLRRDNDGATLYIFHAQAINAAEWVGFDTNFKTFPAIFLNGGGHHIYPEWNEPNENKLHNTVAIQATLSGNVPVDVGYVTLYWKVVDVDDPSQDYGGPGTGGAINAADTNDNALGKYVGGDNRPSGQIGINPSSGTIVIPAGTLSGRSATLTITGRRPGNNWKFVIGYSQTHVNAAILNEAIPNGNDGSLSFLWNQAGSISVGGNTVHFSAGTIDAQHQSRLLSVWRTLHIEVDSMAAVANNIVWGKITGIVGNAGTLFAVTANDSGSLSDGSPDLSAGTGNGRFENGSISVGYIPSGGSFVAVAATTTLTGNGTNYFRAPNLGFVSVPFTIFAASSTTPSASGTITLLTTGGGTLETLVGSSASLTSGAYEGGTVSIAGNTFNVDRNSTQSFFTVGIAEIPFQAHDDDADFLLPYPLGGPPTEWNEVATIYAPAYIRPVIDGGGNSGNNKRTVPFRQHLPANDVEDFITTAAGALESHNNRKDDFWVAYVLMAYQSSAKPFQVGTPSPINPARGDVDPNSEFALGGVATGLNGKGSVYYVEEERDESGLIFEQRVHAHEIAHQFGIDDGIGGIMDSVVGNPKFTPRQIDFLRNRAPSPGKSGPTLTTP
jgi:hypothetical protein